MELALYKLLLLLLYFVKNISFHVKRYRKRPQPEFRRKLAMNVTESKEGSLVVICPMNEMVWRQEYQVENIAFAMTAIISFPVTILMNVLVIMAVKTRPRLQSKYNILLACLREQTF